VCLSQVTRLKISAHLRRLAVERNGSLTNEDRWLPDAGSSFPFSDAQELMRPGGAGSGLSRLRGPGMAKTGLRIQSANNERCDQRCAPESSFDRVVKRPVPMLGLMTAGNLVTFTALTMSSH